jgi:hypothetical protein
MRKGIVVHLSAADRARLGAIVADRNSPQKHVWRAQIILFNLASLGTIEITRRIGKSKTASGAGKSGSWSRASRVSAVNTA